MSPKHTKKSTKSDQPNQEEKHLKNACQQKMSTKRVKQKSNKQFRNTTIYK